MVIYSTVAGNSSPDLQTTLKRNGSAIDLTGATVSLIIYNENTREVTNSSHQTCTLVTASSGLVSYSPTSTDFPSEGRYIGDYKIVFSNGDVERLYEYMLVVVRAAIS